MLYTYFFAKGGNDWSFFMSGLINGELKGFFRAVLIGYTLGTVFFFYSQWAEAIKREQKLTQEKLVFQYETLKNQVNPHFLFNSLNTLSSLVGKDAELSEVFIQKLSSVYRYILENMEKELVPVSTEIDFVNDYFYLQQIRDQQKIKLIIDVSKMENVKIPPVSIQMLVENALKHNVSTKSNPLKILIQNEGRDELVVSNKLRRKQQLNDTSKIGLKNLNERCKLILNREIEIIDTMEEFIVKVPVKAD
jgi:LytS/YehU family sensor histidine kinase